MRLHAQPVRGEGLSIQVSILPPKTGFRENWIPGKINCLYHVLSTVNKVATKWSFTCRPHPLTFLPCHALVTCLKLHSGLQFFGQI